jgi:hypothetical protein
VAPYELLGFVPNCLNNSRFHRRAGCAAPSGKVDSPACVECPRRIQTLASFDAGESPGRRRSLLEACLGCYHSRSFVSTTKQMRFRLEAGRVQAGRNACGSTGSSSTVGRVAKLKPAETEAGCGEGARGCVCDHFGDRRSQEDEWFLPSPIGGTGRFGATPVSSDASDKSLRQAQCGLADCANDGARRSLDY